MTEQRLQALERLRRNMTGTSGQPVRILPRDMEQGLKEFASGVEQLVDRLVRCRACLLQPASIRKALQELAKLPFDIAIAIAPSMHEMQLLHNRRALLSKGICNSLS